MNKLGLLAFLSFIFIFIIFSSDALAFNFDLSHYSPDPSSGSVIQGNSITDITVSACLISGTSQPVSFSASPAISGVSYSFSPISCTPDCGSTMTITTSSTTPTGTYSITITGTGGGVTNTTKYTLTVTSPSKGSISLSRSPASVSADGKSTFTITATLPSAPGSVTTIKFNTNLGTFYKTGTASDTCVMCTSNSCAVSLDSITPGTATVTATASGYTDGTTTVEFTAITWSITLTANPNPLPADSSTDLWADTNHAVGPFGYKIIFYEVGTSGTSTSIKTCSATGTSCSDPITQSTAGTHHYIAKVVAQDGFIQAASSTVDVTWTQCTPTTCSQLGKECGSWDDGCGGTVNCPSCTSTKTCQNGLCVSPGSCGNGVCDSGETQSSCCQDCGCPSGQTCSSGSCVSSSAFDFSLSVNPNSGTVVQGNNVTTTVNATLISGTTQQVDFSLSLPSSAVGVSASWWSSPSCNPNCSLNLQIFSNTQTPAGSYPITITATGGGKTHSTPTPYTLKVNQPTSTPYISLSASQSSVPANGKDTSTITATLSDKASGKLISFTRTLGTLSPNNCTTNSSGSCPVTIKSSTAGTATVNGSASGYTQGQATVIFTTPSTTTCTGTVSLSLSPNPANPSATITSSASGLSGCDGKTVSIKQDSCSGTQKCTCSASGSGCSCFLTVPSSTGSYTYYACVDKNADGDYADSGESAAKTLTVTTSASSWSITLSASSTSLSVGSYTTLTAIANKDVGTTEFDIIIYQNGTEIKRCLTGTSCSVSVTNATAITHSYTAEVIDAYGYVAQATSNTVSVTWTSTTPGLLPDLVITDIWIEDDSKINYTIKNQGDGATGQDIWSWVSIDGAYKTNDLVGPLGPGESATGNGFFGYKWNCNGTSDTIKVYADYQNHIKESNETNNDRTEIFTCPGVFGFNVSVNPNSGTVTQGSSITTTVTAALISGTAQSVNFSASGLPSGATASFSPTSCNPTCTSTMNIFTNSTTPTGNYLIIVIGIGGGVTNTTTYVLTVSQQSTQCTHANPTVSIIPSSQSGLAGSVLQYTVNITNGDSGTSCTRQVFLLTSACLSDWTCSLALPSLSVAPGSSNTTTINVTSPSAASGNNPVYVIATSGISSSYSSTGSATYTVATACSRDNPNVTVNPSGISKQAGENQTFTIIVTNNDSSICGNSTFNLTTDCPQGWGCTLNPSSVLISPGSSNSSNITIKSNSTAALGQYLINLTVANRADTKYNATKSIGFIVIPKCDGASIEITDAYVYNNSGKVTVQNNGTAGNLTITSVNITDKSGNIYKADNLPITNFDVKETAYINFSTAPDCTNISKVTVATDCPKASDSYNSTEVRCPTTPPTAIIEIVNVTQKASTVNATLRNIGGEAIDSGSITILLDGKAVECKQTFTLAPKGSNECDISNFVCSGTVAKLEITEPNKNETEFACEKSIEITAQSCKDANCNQPLETFTKGENIYFNVETNPADANVTAVIQGGTGTIDLTKPFKPEEVGSYTIELTASKEGYSEATKELSFAVEAKSGVSPKIIIVILIIVGLAGFIYYRLKKTGKTETFQKLYEKYGKKETYEDLYRKYSRNRRYRRRS